MRSTQRARWIALLREFDDDLGIARSGDDGYLIDRISGTILFEAWLHIKDTRK